MAGTNGDWKKEGYTIKGIGSPDAVKRGDNWQVNAYDKSGNVVGTLLVYDLGHAITASDVQVKEAHQRKGLASAMYEYAEKKTGKEMLPADQVSDDPDNMTDDAKEFWKNRKYAAVEPVIAGMLDFPRKKLPDEIWLYEPDRPLPRLQPKIRAAILSEGRYRLKKFGAKLIGANLYGGAATYQYHKGGDIDVSLYIDWDDFKGNEELLQEAFKTVEIPWGDYELHLFVKPSNQQEQVEVADAYYDVMKDEWKLPPLVLPKDFDPEIFFKPMVEMAEQKAQRMDLLMGQVSREWSRLKKCLRALQEGARDEHVVRERAHLTKQVLLDRIEVLCEEFVEIWKNRKKLHDQLRQRYVNDRNIGRFERFQFPEVCWKYLDEMGYVEYLKVLAKANEAGVIKNLLDEVLPEGEPDEAVGD